MEIGSNEESTIFFCILCGKYSTQTKVFFMNKEGKKVKINKKLNVWIA